MSRPFTTTRPPPVESLGVAYFTPLMSPLPVVKRIPQPAPNADTITTYLRLQSAGGAQLVQSGQEGYFWSCNLILHSYSPLDQEGLAEDNLGIALGWGSNAQGLTVTTGRGVPWSISYSSAPNLGTKVEDPQVALTRYRGLVNWRVMGNPLQ